MKRSIQQTSLKHTPVAASLHTSGRLRIAFALCIVLAFVATMLFLFVSVFFLPFVIRWDAARPFALLAAYIFLFGLTVLPFWAARYLNQIMQNDTTRSPRAAVFLALSGLLLIPAFILIPMAADDVLMRSGRSSLVVFGLPGVLCVALSMFLAHIAIQLFRSKRSLAKKQPTRPA